MHRSSVFISIVVGFGVFTFLSVDILRDIYGEAALLAVYAVLAVLTTFAVYTFAERISGIASEDEEEQNTESISQDEEKDEELDSDVVEKEMENLKQG